MLRVRVHLVARPPFHSDERKGLFSPIGQDHQWVRRASPEKVLLVRLGSETSAYDQFVHTGPLPRSINVRSVCVKCEDEVY